MENITNNKKTLTLILILLIVVFIFLIYITFFKRTNNNLTLNPTPSPANIPNSPYNDNNLTQDYIRIKNAKPLSSSDERVKEKLLGQISNKSGNLKRTDTYSIDYVATAGQFMVEINSPEDADKAKKDSEQWLMGQGLSQQGICNMPVVYFLGGFTMQTYRQQNKQFNPIPDGC